MRLCLNGPSPEKADSQGMVSRYLLLPGLCCQAAGGKIEQADQFTLVWLLHYQAAHLMDSIQDGDEPETWWVDRGPGYALSVATGLYFSASLALQQLAREDLSPATVRDVQKNFLSAMLRMTSGQHLDISTPTTSLEQYWRNTQAKSGEFFAQACWAGARLQTRRRQVLDHYHDFGKHLGIMIQVKDDLDEVLAPNAWSVEGQRANFRSSLPVIYALDVFPEPQRNTLLHLLDTHAQDQHAANEAMEMIDDAGASIYVAMQIEHHRTEALLAIRRANPDPHAAEQLETLLQGL